MTSMPAFMDSTCERMASAGLPRATIPCASASNPWERNRLAPLAAVSAAAARFAAMLTTWASCPFASPSNIYICMAREDSRLPSKATTTRSPDCGAGGTTTTGRGLSCSSRWTTAAMSCFSTPWKLVSRPMTMRSWRSASASMSLCGTPSASMAPYAAPAAAQAASNSFIRASRRWRAAFTSVSSRCSL